MDMFFECVATLDCPANSCQKWAFVSIRGGDYTKHDGLWNRRSKSYQSDKIM